MIEDHILKLSERTSIAFCLHAEQRAFPAIEDKISSFVGIEAGIDFASLLSLFKAASYVAPHPLKNALELRAKRVADDTHFLGQVPDGASGFGVFLFPLKTPGDEETPKPMERGPICSPQRCLAQSAKEFSVVIDQRQTQLVFTFKIEIEGSLRDSRTLKDLLNTCIIEPFLAHDLCRVLYYFFFGILFSHESLVLSW
jgi:hypothetical protein